MKRTQMIQRLVSVCGAAAAAFAFSAAAPAAYAATYYVAPGGSDNTGTGTLAKPFATIQRATWNVAAGDTILLRGGVYHLAKDEWIGGQSGMATAPITIKAYGAGLSIEKPILDGGGTSATNALEVGVPYVLLQNLEVRNSSAYGITLSGYDSVINCTVDNSQQSGIWLTGTGNAVTGCALWNNVKDNSPRTPGFVWGSCIDGYLCSQARIVSNTVYDNWGEGINFQNSTNCYVGYNDVRDSFSTNLYLNSCFGCTLDTNTCHCNWDTAYFRNGGPANGIELGNEWALPTLNWNSVKGNLVSVCQYGIQLWSGGAGGGVMRNTEIQHNTFQTATTAIVLLEGTDCTGSSLHDNKFGLQWNQNVTYSGAGLSVYNNTTFGP